MRASPRSIRELAAERRSHFCATSDRRARDPRRQNVVIGTSSLAPRLRSSSSIALAAMAWLGVLTTQLPQRCEAQSSTVHVRTTSHPRGVWLHERASEDASAWVSLCAAPCEADVRRGAVLGLSLDGLAARAVDALTLDEGALLQLRFDDRHLTRTYGLIVAVIGVVGALTLGLGGTTAWLAAGGQGDMTGPVTAMASAAGVLALGLSVGIVLMNEGDQVEITLTR